MVGGPSYTAVLVEDVERSTAFYERFFGWKRSGVQPMGGEMFNTKPAIFLVLPREAGHMYSGERVGYGMQIALMCDDLDQHYIALQAAGVEIAAPMMDNGFQRLFSFLDPDGYVIVLSQDTSSDG